MAKSPQTAAEALPPDASRCESLRKIAESLGVGEVRLYNLKKHTLPEVVNTPPEQQLAEIDWWLVHFPSRKCVAVLGGRSEGMRLLKQLGAGKDEMHLMTLFGAKKAHARARAGGCVGVRAQGAADGENKPDAAQHVPTKKRVKTTKVPEGLGFDASMKYVFPNARITREIEKLLAAEDEVVDREGNVVGSRPAWMVRKEAVKLMIEHAQGRAGEKPPPPPDKKKVSYDELEKMILSSDAAFMYFKRLLEKREAANKVLAVPPAGSEEGKV